MLISILATLGTKKGTGANIGRTRNKQMNRDLILVTILEQQEKQSNRGQYWSHQAGGTYSATQFGQRNKNRVNYSAQLSDIVFSEEQKRLSYFQFYRQSGKDQ